MPRQPGGGEGGSATFCRASKRRQVGHAEILAAHGAWSATGSLVIEHWIEKYAGYLLLVVQLKSAAVPLRFPHLFHKESREVGLHQALPAMNLMPHVCPI